VDNSAESVFVQFYSDAIEIKHKSEKEGRPIYENVTWIRKVIPGDKNNIIERVAKPDDFQRHAKAYERFKRSETEAVDGTPLEQWPQINRAEVKEAKYREVHTVEQMAALTDLHVQKLGMGFQTLRDKAKSYLSVAANTAAATAQAAENQRLKDMLADMQAQLDELGAKKPGRPRKESVEA